MSITLGGQTVTFVKISYDGTPDEFGQAVRTRTDHDVPGCHFRPLTYAEKGSSDFTVTDNIWKCTAPATDVVMATNSKDELKADGITYQVLSQIMPKRDLAGTVSHVTIMCGVKTG